ncbi:unnamed protein product [Nesidiocoris tenuis]|uniref:tRNA (adenine(58)-N(1))-methyltransferase non-catalytic subunit TRM6 n=1 Tax=Nesidiocoris tenuis TaxID=355587 RepID=A0A6H5HPR9_9HEMI|nr:unnamed protein product [Nesidiocoris tenuis]
MEIRESIKIGDYVVIQKQKYLKLHQLKARCDVMLGKDLVNLKAIVGQPFWTTFKMIQKKKKEFDLDVASEIESLPEAVMKDVQSGSDNRNITDDGKSQLLSTEEIEGFKESGLSAQSIVGKLIESSTTFHNKTEYSQEKYLKKKEKKYFEYIVIRKPTVRLLAEMFYSKDPHSVLGLRHDSIAQILSYANVQNSGTYVLFESGTQALLGSAILDCLDDQGRVISITTGRYPPKQAVVGMNFPEEKRAKSFLSVTLTDFLTSLEKRFSEESTNGVEEAVKLSNGEDGLVTQAVPSTAAELTGNEKATLNGIAQNVLPASTEDSKAADNGLIQEETSNSKKRKQEPDTINDCGTPALKKPRWQENLEIAKDALLKDGADSLIFASKEFPLPLILKMLDYLKPSHSLVVYSVYREPLVLIYNELKKKRKDVIGLHIFENFLRTHQILSDRTRPDVMMSASGGHILVGTKVLSS